MRRWQDPLQTAAAILGPRDPRRIGTSTLELILAITRGRRGGLFSCDTETHLGLVVSRAIDQTVIDTVTALWKDRRGELFVDEGYYAPGPPSFFVLACAEATTPLCLLYADTGDAAFRLPADELATFRGILTRAFTDPLLVLTRSEEVEEYLLHTSPDDIERDRLVLLLGRHEWNIARVARLLGTTRDTIYRRIRQYDLRRLRIAKTRSPA